MPRRKEAHREIEIKLRVSDLATTVTKLKEIGAAARGRVLERNTLFDTEKSDFRQRARLLRLRTEAPAGSEFAPAGAARTILTAKSPASEARGRAVHEQGKRDERRYKVNLEREVLVEDPAPPPPSAARKLRDRGWTFALGVLGLKAGFRYEKYRTKFEAGAKRHLVGLHMSLDETPVGNFLELEGAPEAIDQVARELGFGPRDYIRATYYDLYVAERRRRGRPVRNMVFRA